MSNKEDEGRWSEFLACVRRFTEMTLDRLGKASVGKDVDEKETRRLSGLVLTALSIWKEALTGSPSLVNLKADLGEAESHGPRGDSEG